MTPSSHLVTEGDIDIFTFDRPGKRNAIDAIILDDLDAAIDSNNGSRSLVITGGGSDFSAGADLHASHDLSQWLEVLKRLERLPAPTIAAIEGYCLGAGLLIAAACDLRIGAEGAQLGMPEIAAGMIAGLGTSWRLPRLVGVGRTEELVLLGTSIDATTALEWGLVNRVVSRGQALPEACRLVRELSIGRRSVWGATKSLYHDDQALDTAVSHELDAATRLNGTVPWGDPGDRS
ncbi:MAG: enoyl-CoA hydratase/isomerase family protein [Candidatus Dormibacteria bacterium]